jgi:Bacterial membrane protein YfhO
MPGWSVTVDGHSAPIFRGNHAQRVIPLPVPGRHSIVMNYQPPGLVIGRAITLLSIAAWMLIVGHSLSRALASPAGKTGDDSRGAVRCLVKASPPPTWAR